MDYICADVLRHLRRLSDGCCQDMVYAYAEPRIYLRDGGKEDYYDYSRWKGEIESIVRVLMDGGYVEGGQDVFRLTHKGLHPLAVGWDAFVQFLLTSVLLPAVVSAATALATLWLEGLLRWP